MKLRQLAPWVFLAAVGLFALNLDETRVAAAPGLTVSSVSIGGPFLTATGNGFGTKSVVAPVKYDDFQSVALGSEVVTSTAPGPAWKNGGDCCALSNYEHPKASSVLLRPGTGFTRNMRSHWHMPASTGKDSSNVALTGQNFTRLYFDAWTYHDTRAATTTPQNVKIIRLHQARAGSPNAYVAMTTTSSGDSNCAGRDGTGTQEPAQCGAQAVNGGIPNNAAPGSFMYNNWRHLQIIGSPGTTGQLNGTWIIYIDGKLRWNRPGNILMTNGGFTSWPEIFIGNYVRDGDWTGDIYAYWESVYVDNSWARVEIGNNPVYGNSTQREIQVPVTWANGQVQVRINKGSFPNLTGKYLFVIDSDNNISPGFPLDSAAVGPDAPKNLRVIPGL